MPTLFIYLCKVNIAVIAFYLIYRMLLRPLTFYSINRYYLQFAWLFSASYPFIDFQRWFTAGADVSMALPLRYAIAEWESTPVAGAGPGVWTCILWVFWIIVLYFAARFMMRLFSLWQIHAQSTPSVWYIFRYRYVKEAIRPFSFWRTIYVHPNGKDDQELFGIFSHEQVHVDQLHTLDTLLAELFALFCWFNPFVWLMRHAVRENIEFITDRQVIRSGIDKQAYQYSLLSFCHSANAQRIGFAEAQEIASNFNFKHLKTRISMMNKKRTPLAHMGKYVCVVPVVVLLALVFTWKRAEESVMSIQHEPDGASFALAEIQMPPSLSVALSAAPVSSSAPAPLGASASVSASPSSLASSSASVPGNRVETKADFRAVSTPRSERSPVSDSSTDSGSSADSDSPLDFARSPASEPVSNNAVVSVSVSIREPRPIHLRTDTGDLDLPMTLRSRFREDSSKQPLVVVDGVRREFNNLGGLKASTITSVTLLKKAAATALYGEDAQQGGIIITTKGASAANNRAVAIDRPDDRILSGRVIRIDSLRSSSRSKIDSIRGSAHRTITVRGQSTIRSSRGNPLILIDRKEGDMSTLSQDQIRSIKVLKDDPDLVRDDGSAVRRGGWFLSKPKLNGKLLKMLSLQMLSKFTVY